MTIPCIYAIVPAKNEAASIANVMRQLQRAGVAKMLILANGCTDETLSQAKATTVTLSTPVHLLSVDVPLGHDVPKAVATTYALQHLTPPTHWLYVDGDWSGAFGPMLASFLNTGLNRTLDALWPARSRAHPTHPLRTVLTRWDHMAQSGFLPPHLAQVAPFQMPHLISHALFQQVSPTTLATPLEWFTQLFWQERVGAIRLGVDIEWDLRLTGHRSTSALHHKKMQQTLLQETEAVYCKLKDPKVSPKVSVANANNLLQRRLDWLDTYILHPRVHETADGIIHLLLDH